MASSFCRRPFLSNGNGPIHGDKGIKRLTLRACTFALAASLCASSPVKANLFEYEQDYERQQRLQELHGFVDQTIEIVGQRLHYYFYNGTDPSTYQVEMFVDVRQMWRSLVELIVPSAPVPSTSLGSCNSAHRDTTSTNPDRDVVAEALAREFVLRSVGQASLAVGQMRLRLQGREFHVVWADGGSDIYKFAPAAGSQFVQPTGTATVYGDGVSRNTPENNANVDARCAS